MNKITNHEIATTLIRAKEHLNKGDFNPKANYICIALEHVCVPRYMIHYIQDNIIMKRLGKSSTMTKFLLEQGISSEELTKVRVQRHRHAWLDMLIEEFTKKAQEDKKRMAIAKVFRDAIELLWDGESNLRAYQFTYICHAIKKSSTIYPGQYKRLLTQSKIDALAIITDRLGVHYSLEAWLGEQGFVGSESEYQTHRINWLRLLVKEFIPEEILCYN